MIKKFILFGTAVTAIVTGLVSCSHDFEGNNLSQAEIAYRTSFVKTFGVPAADQDWGFGSDETAGARMTRTIQPSYNFPSDAAATKFLAAVPAGVQKLTQNVGRANNYIDETWQGDLNIWGGATAEGNWQDRSGGVLYIKGNCDFSNRSFYFDGNSELYLLEGATLTLNANSAANLQQNTMIYMAAGSKIVTPGELKLNNGLHIYNHGTIEANKLSTNSNSLLYNVGKVYVTTKISVENELSVVVNDGIINAADLNTAGSGKIENNDSVRITGTTFVNSNSNTWVNNGHYHTGNFIYNAGSDEVINNCRLTVDEDFNINLGDNQGNGNFKMDAGSGVVTKNFNGGGNWSKYYSIGWSSFNGGPFYVYMGANSVFKVTGTCTLNATKADYGFYGPETGGYAVLDAKEIKKGADNQGYEVTYGNNLYVYTENHFGNGYSGQYPYIDFKGNAKIFAPGFEDGKPAITIQPSRCCAGFAGSGSEGEGEGGESGDTPELTPDVRIIAEDLSASESSDFDFNDVVFDVTFTSSTTALVTLQAAGGTLPLTVAGVEVHDMFGVSTSTMVNTFAGNKSAYAPVSFEITGIDSSKRGRDIEILVLKGDEWCPLEAHQGVPAAKIAVKPTFVWCDEYEAIESRYPLFRDWVQNREVIWY
ncbi:hypothetical protein [uncultured Prevotella sp.]|uniref:hypothetical protein n=1 Tax=uncultured Prevotella sp. TaxID=159272 RepID=UPI00258B6B1B|nr:hypothetical protein [uncultured Prevotella sp.]